MSNNIRINTEELEKIDIIKVASVLGLIIKRNKTLCFLHSEKTPSLSFDRKANRWKCFGCAAHGGVIDLVKEFKKVSFIEACNWLETTFLTSNQSRQIARNLQTKERMQQIVTSCDTRADFDLYEEIISLLYLSDSDIQYLCERRALSQDIVTANRLRSIINIEDFYSTAITRFGYDRLIKSGLLKIDENGEVKKTFWSPGILFPYYAYDGRIANLQLRPYKPFPIKAKYVLLNNTKTLLYNERLLHDLEPKSTLFLCEGAVDTLSILTMGNHAVGLPGVGNFKEQWIPMVQNFSIRIAFDNDSAGQKNAELLQDRLLKSNIDTRIIRVSPYKDVNEGLIAERARNNEQC